MDTELWLGSSSLYREYLSRREQMSASLYTSSQDNYSEDPENFTLFGNVAVIDITGTLTNDDSFWTRLMGDTSYNQIRRCLIEAAVHEDVKAILMNIDSGGGTPNGLADVADMIQQITLSGKPVHAYSGGVMASAAYWLGAAAQKVACGETADVGSIGVIAIHKEYTDMMKKDGVKATVFRAGEEKALGTPFEKLTETAKELIQSRIDTLYAVFVENIAKFRNVPVSYVLETMADGKEFIGQQALDVGLVDTVTTLDDLISRLQSQIDKQAGKETPMARKTTSVLTQTQRDAMMEGAAVEAVLMIEPTEVEIDPVEVAAEVAPIEEALEVVKPVEDNLVSFLREDLAAKTQEIIQLNTKLSATESELSTFKSVHEPMKKLVATSISRMQVALGAPMMDVSDMPAELLLAQHAKITEVFCKKYPVGGVAAVQAEETKQSPVSPVNAARMRQNKI